MISVHDPDACALDGARAPAPGRWLDVVAPTAGEREVLLGLGVPYGLIVHALDTDELARVDHDESGARLFVLRVPSDSSAAAEVVPLGVITAPGECLVTISSMDTGLPAKIAARAVDPAMPETFFLDLALEVAERFVRTLQSIEAEINRLEGLLRKALQNDEILSLLELQKRLVHLDVALHADQLVIERALSDRRIELSESQKRVAEDVLVELRQAGVVTRTKKELLGETMDALATVVSNNLNVAMKQLASLTLMVSIPAVFAGLYGMNVALPFASSPVAFAGVLVVSLVVVIGLALALRARGWL